MRRKNPSNASLATHIFDRVHAIMASDSSTRSTATWMMKHRKTLVSKGGPIYEVAEAVAAKKTKTTHAEAIAEYILNDAAHRLHRGVGDPDMRWGLSSLNSRLSYAEQRGFMRGDLVRETQKRSHRGSVGHTTVKRITPKMRQEITDLVNAGGLQVELKKPKGVGSGYYLQSIAAKKAPAAKAIPKPIEGIEYPAMQWRSVVEATRSEGTPLPGAMVADDHYHEKNPELIPAVRAFAWEGEPVSLEGQPFTIEMRKWAKPKKDGRSRAYFAITTEDAGDESRQVVNLLVRRMSGLNTPPLLWTNAPASPAKKTMVQLADAIAKTVDKDGRKGRGKTREMMSNYAGGDLVAAVFGVRLGEKNGYGGWNSWFGPGDTSEEILRFLWSQRVPRLSQAVASKAASDKVHRDRLKATQGARKASADAKMDALIAKYEKVLGKPQPLPPRITPDDEVYLPAPRASIRDVSSSTASMAFQGTSFSAERRGEQYRREYASMWNDMAEEAADMADTVNQRRTAIAELGRFLTKYKAAFRAFLGSRAGTTSWMITGRGGRNERREQKKSDSADRRQGDWLDLIKQAAKVTQREINKARMEESGGQAGIQLRKLKLLIAARRQGKATGPDLKAAVDMLDDILVRKEASGVSGNLVAPDGTEVGIEITDDRIKLAYERGAPIHGKLRGFNWSRRGQVQQRILTGAALMHVAEVFGIPNWDWRKLVKAIQASNDNDDNDGLPTMAVATKMYRQYVAMEDRMMGYAEAGRRLPGKEHAEMLRMEDTIAKWPHAFQLQASGIDA